MAYPKFKYHQSEAPKMIQSEEEEKSLSKEWSDSPADFGVETCPGVLPDEKIMANKIKLEDQAKKSEKKSASKE